MQIIFREPLMIIGNIVVLLIMLMTNRRSIMGDRVNSRGINVLGWLTTISIFAASIGLVATSFT